MFQRQILTAHFPPIRKSNHAKFQLHRILTFFQDINICQATFFTIFMISALFLLSSLNFGGFNSVFKGILRSLVGEKRELLGVIGACDDLSPVRGRALSTHEATAARTYNL